MIAEQIKNKQATLAVIGLGYVGLPIALEFAKKVKVIGFDINASRVSLMNQSIDPSGELSSESFLNTDILFSSNPEDLKKANFFIVAVPTPIDGHNLPDLKPLLSAASTVGKALKKGDYVVFESTVYPGCTEEDCVPILEQESGLKFVSDFKVGYSPERINPGDKVHTLPNIIKVVAGCDTESAENIAEVYRQVVKVGVYPASSIKVAEAAKIIENTQRDLNIALMNELSMICDRLQINTFDVLAAAGTKWNFLKFTPGLVGGHCIGVDPYYLTYKAKMLGHFPQVILSGRSINDSMGAHVAKKTVQLLLKQGKDIRSSRVLVLGATFKENVSDIRNSKVVDVIKELISFSVHVDVYDPKADASEFEHEYQLPLISEIGTAYDGIVAAVSHSEFDAFDESYFLSITSPEAVFIDIKGTYRKMTKVFEYWSL